MLREWLKKLSGQGQERGAGGAAKRLQDAKANRYHAVSLLPGPRCCDAIKQFTDTRFLTSEAPKLPLEACDKAQCNCRYKHHPDRRDESRRLVDSGVFGTPIAYRGDEKRQGRGRRKTDTGAQDE